MRPLAALGKRPVAAALGMAAACLALHPAAQVLLPPLVITHHTAAALGMAAACLALHPAAQVLLPPLVITHHTRMPCRASEVGEQLCWGLANIGFLLLPPLVITHQPACLAGRHRLESSFAGAQLT